MLPANVVGTPVGADGAEQGDSSGAGVVFPAAAPATTLPTSRKEGTTGGR